MQGTASRLDLRRILPAGAAQTTYTWNDGNVAGGYRVDVTDGTTGVTYFLNVLSTDGAVTAASESSAGGVRGVSLTLSDGRTALVRFNEQSTGGTLELRAQGGAILQQGPLPTTVTVPPVF
jgi:hypothetical protein